MKIPVSILAVTGGQRIRRFRTPSYPRFDSHLCTLSGVRYLCYVQQPSLAFIVVPSGGLLRYHRSRRRCRLVGTTGAGVATHARGGAQRSTVDGRTYFLSDRTDGNHKRNHVRVGPKLICADFDSAARLLAGQMRAGMASDCMVRGVCQETIIESRLLGSAETGIW
ncbi:hypothetical protein DFH06DRAFT_142550 [Mycena polygramma]|nr:hypothetical protein DFH06DRAFT_142550 [Mycena polygramma]